MINYSSTITRNAKLASTLLKAIANPYRLIILSQLKVLGERNVNQLLANIAITQPALSQHLAVMRKEGLIATRKRGTLVYYSINEPLVNNILNALEVHLGQMNR